MDTIKVGDIDICYRTQGGGYPLVLIRGFTASMEEWNPLLVDALAERYRVLVFDNRGAGNTTAPPGSFTMKQFADDTAGLMEALGIDRGYVLGESMGGMVAQEVVLNHPEKVEKLVLCCTFCGGDEAVFPSQEVIELMADRTGTPEEITRRGLPLLFPDAWIEENPDAIDAVVSRALKYPMAEENVERQFEAILGFSTFERLPEIECPTLVACGTVDRIVPRENSRILSGRIPDSTRIEFDGAGHGFMEQCREEFVEKFLEFLGG